MTSKQIVSTATDKVRALAGSIQEGLLVGKRYVDLLNQLVQTKDATDLLAASKELTALDLTNAFIHFPQHYQPADYYLLFMARMLELGDQEGIQLHQEERTLVANLQPLEADLTFKFELDEANGGAFFADQRHHEPLFYLNLARRVIHFDNDALINFFIVKQSSHYNDLDLERALAPLLAFARLAAERLGFTVDRGILATANAANFRLQKPDLDLAVIDRLFIATADSDDFLLSLPKNNGAQLKLAHQVQLRLSYDPDDYSQQWGFAVLDPAQQVSFFGVLLHSALVRKWFLENRDQLALQATRMLPVADAPVKKGTVNRGAAPTENPTPKEDPDA